MGDVSVFIGRWYLLLGDLDLPLFGLAHSSLQYPRHGEFPRYTRWTVKLWEESCGLFDHCEGERGLGEEVEIMVKEGYERDCVYLDTASLRLCTLF